MAVETVLEKWLNTFGGNANLKPDTPNDNKLTRWAADAANKNLNPSTPQVPPANKIPPATRTSARPSNAAGMMEQTTNNSGKVNWRFAAPDQSIPRGAQVVPVSEPTGRKVVPSLNNASTSSGPTSGPQARIGAPPKWELPWNKPKINLSSALGAPAAGAEALFHSESLNVGEFDGEDGQAWIDQNRPEGWTSSTMSVESDIMSRVAVDSKSKIKAVGLAEEKLKVLVDSGASVSLINQAESELAAARDTPITDHFADYKSEVEAELSEVQTLLDLKIQEYYVAGNPELTQQKLEASGWLDRKDALVNKLTDIDLIDKSNKVQQDTDASTIVDLANDITPDEINSLTDDDKTTIEKEAKTGLEAFFDGTVKTLKGAMSLAGEGLGDLWGQKAIRNALVYYMGARLMGYSASGSGMAAGDVLIKGWENQADVDKVTAEAATKSAQNNAIDMSKTVNYVDQYGNFQKVYASKNGKFLNHPKLGTIDVSKTGWRPAATGEKDRQTRKLDATDSVNKIQDQVLTNLRSQLKNADGEGMYDENNVAKVTQMFQEAGLSQQMVDSYTDSYGIDGLEKSIPLLRRAMESYASSVAGGEEVNIASLMGHLDRSVITSGKTQVPKAVYHSEGKVVGSDAMNILSNKLSKVHQVQNGYIDAVKASPDLTDDQKEEFIYSMKTEGTKADILIQLNKSFNAIPPNHMDFWKKQAKDSNKSSPFIMWLTSVTDPGRQHSSYESLNINVYRDLGLIPSNKKE